MQHGTYDLPESHPGRTGITTLGRRLVWRLARPYFDDLVRQTAERTAELSDECAILRSDLLATNHRISWLEEQLAAATTASPAATPTPASKASR